MSVPDPPTRRSAAGAAVEHVVAGAAVEDVGAGRAGQAVVGRAAGEVLHVGPDEVVLAGLAVVCDPVEVGGHGSRAGRVGHGVGVGAAVRLVAGAAPDVEHVVAGAAIELVGGVVAGQRVVAQAAEQPLDVGTHVVGLGGLAVVGGAVEVDGDAGDAGAVVGGVRAGAAVVRVAARAALEQVVAGVAVEHVGGRLAVQRVVAGAAGERVGERAAGQRVACRAADHGLDVGADRVVLARRAVAVEAVERDRDRGHAAGVGDGVGARAAGQDVVAVAAVERVVRRLAVDRVVAGSAGQHVDDRGRPAEDGVVARPAGDVLDVDLDVVGLGGRDAVARLAVVGRAVDRDGHGLGTAGVVGEVGPGPAVEDVVAGPADERVVAGVAVERVDAGASHEPVGVRAAVERVVRVAAGERVVARAAAQRGGRGAAADGDRVAAVTRVEVEAGDGPRTGTSPRRG